MTDAEPLAPIGIIGGSGLYSLLGEATTETVDTPYGAPSSRLTRGRIGGRPVVFLTRHGEHHEIAPHAINYRANLWALKSSGCDAVITSSAVGSLRPGYAPGDFVLTDQFIDRTTRRIGTFFDGPRVVHVSVADPYCPALRTGAEHALHGLGERFHATGCAIVFEGPRFSTRAESAWYRQMGGDVLSMTQHPETTLARELEMCCVNLSFVSDADDGGEHGEPVTAGQVWRRLADNQDRIRRALAALVASVDPQRACSCRSALADT